jgi:pimeloyl-ACP methyl ester carboxylesterase
MSFAGFHGYRIWYRVAKSSTSDSTTPILLLHGGPGLGSDYLEPLESLADQGRTVIRFDQLGSGRSERPRDLSIWTLEGCIGQIDSIRDELGLDRIHLLGHSWGGMVALKYLLTRPLVVQSAILCSSVVSVQLWASELRRLCSLMPNHTSTALDLCAKSLLPRKPPEHGAKPARSLTQEEIDRYAWWMNLGFLVISRPCAARFASWMLCVPKFRPLAYFILDIQFNLRHGCRLEPMPFGILRSLAGSNEEINETLMGPSEFYPTGVLKDWDFTPHLPEICCFTLIISGQYDMATSAQMAVLKAGIANSEQIILEKSAHLGMWEEPEKYRAAILGFINRVEFADV